MDRNTVNRGGRRNEGAILVSALILTLVVMLFVSQAVTTTFVDGKSSRHSLNYVRALSIAEGITEAAQKRILDEVANFQPPTLEGIVDIAGVSYEYTATPVGPEINRLDVDGVTLVIQPYQITASIDVERASATVQRIVDLTMTPIFQYMIYYNDDLEVLPGPNMILEGRVHSNQSIYIGAGSTLTVDTDYMRCTGDIFRQRKNNGSQTGGTVDIKVFGEDNYVEMTPTMDSDNVDWVTLALDTWGGTVQSGEHGVTAVSVPEFGAIHAYHPVTGDKGHYHETADLVIRDGLAYDTNDNPVSLPAGVLTDKTFYDAREGKMITVTEIDIELLNASGFFPANGLIYAYRSDVSSSQANGIRLTNGAELAADLTVVTENPLYIHGDYNSVDKKASAVMCDAINLLSNAWDDTKTQGSLPRASATMYNTAVVTGNVPTPDGGGNYSGGFENLPRFHEKWSGVTATIRGAFIKIFESQYGAAPWSYGGDVYKAPIRDWRFEPNFGSSAGMPPFTPNAVYARRVMWDDNLDSPLAQ